MAEEELMSKTLYIAREAALFLLGNQDTVLPFSLTVDASGDSPQTYFPSDAQPGASVQELLDSAVAYLTTRVTSNAVAAVAIVTPLESGAETAIGIQVETRTSAISLVYPYQRDAQGWTLTEPAKLDGLLLYPVLVRP